MIIAWIAQVLSHAEELIGVLCICCLLLLSLKSIMCKAMSLRTNMKIRLFSHQHKQFHHFITHKTTQFFRQILTQFD